MRSRNVPLIMAVVVESMGYGAIFALLADLQDHFHFANWGLGLIASSAFPAALVGQLGLSRHADRGHTRRLLWIGLATAAAGMVWFAFGNTLWEFVVARILVGFGSGTFIPAARRVMISQLPDNKGQAVAAIGAADIGGFLLGVPVAAGLKVALGLRAPFLLMAIVLAVIGPIAASIPEPAIEDHHEKLAVRKVLGLDGARCGLAIGIGFSVAIGTLDAIASRYLKDLGAHDLQIAAVMVALGLPLVLFMPLAGRMVDKYGAARVGPPALLVAVPVMVVFGFLSSLIVVGVFGALLAASNSVVYTSGQAAVANATRDGLVAAGQGTYEATAAIGGFTCSLIAPLLYHRGHPVTMWATMAALVVVAASAARWWGRRVERPSGSVVVRAAGDRTTAGSG